MLASVLLALVGLALGSYLTVVTLRYRPERRLFSLRDTGGRSRCAACGTELRWYELLPLLSFVFQRGRCRSCAAQLSLQYPALELAGALAVLGIPHLLAARLGVPWLLAAAGAAPWWYYTLAVTWTAAVLLWVVVFIVDLRHAIIPDGVNLTLAILGLAVAAVATLAALPPYLASFMGPYALLAALPGGPFAAHVVGSVAAGAVFLVLWALSRGRAMGFGDVKLAFASGLLLGWPDAALAVALSFIVGGATGAVLLATRSRGMRDRVPFGPFFVLGALLTLTSGAAILRTYFGAFPR